MFKLFCNRPLGSIDMLSALSRRTIVSNPWMIFLSTAFVVSLAVIDAGVINVALPILSHYFDVNFQIIQWLITAYLFAISSTFNFVLFKLQCSSPVDFLLTKISLLNKSEIASSTIF